MHRAHLRSHKHAVFNFLHRHPLLLVRYVAEAPEAPEVEALQAPSIANALLLRGKLPGTHSCTPIPKGWLVAVYSCVCA
jgi:hypothetical protein